MTEKTPDTHPLRKKTTVIDQRQQQKDPAGKARVDRNEAARHDTKQPGETPVKGDIDAQ